MAQRTEKEETEFKAVPETITLCVNNCGVTGNPATNNMCQKCFNATTAVSTSSSPTGSSTVTMPHKFARSEKSGRFSSLRYSPAAPAPAPARNFDLERTTSQDLKRNVEEVSGGTATVKREVNRCSGCQRKVGLTGFRCRCGELFCGEHRYSDRHDCSYDYKSAGRDAIARENPVVKAAKIVKL